MFAELSVIITNQKLSLKKRKEFYKIYKEKIQVIIDAKYISVGSREIQTKIRNQNTNLITAFFIQIFLLQIMKSREIFIKWL